MGGTAFGIQENVRNNNCNNNNNNNNNNRIREKKRRLDERVRRKTDTWKIRGSDARAQCMADVNLVTKKPILRGIDFRNKDVVDMLHLTLRKARNEHDRTVPLTMEELAELDDGYGSAPQMPQNDRVKTLGDRGCYGGADDR